MSFLNIWSNLDLKSSWLLGTTLTKKRSFCQINKIISILLNFQYFLIHLFAPLHHSLKNDFLTDFSATFIELKINFPKLALIGINRSETVFALNLPQVL